MQSRPARRDQLARSPSRAGAATLWLALAAFSISAEPFVPKNDDEVLERLPYTPGDPALRALAELRSQLRATPGDLGLATRLAWGYVEVGRVQADPRFYGYAEAALAPWWAIPDPPAEVLLLRATLRQNRHEFGAALGDLERFLREHPRDPRGWLQRAVILAVQGEPAAAAQSCLPLRRLAPPLVSAACLAHATGLGKDARAGYDLLRRTLETQPAADPGMRQWALTTLAEIAVRLGRAEAAEAHFRAALEIPHRDPYLLAARADFLLDQHRPSEARTLLADETSADALLLRLALAEQQLGAPGLAEHRAALTARFEAARRRGDALHEEAAARFALHFGGDPVAALRLAEANWAVQREPIDARRLLEAALAARRPEAARPVLEHLARTGLEDVRLKALTERLTEVGS